MHCLVQASKEVNAWVVARPRTFLLPIYSLKAQEGAERHSEHQCVAAWHSNHAINTWIAGGFSKTHLSMSKENCGYRSLPSLSHHVQLNYEPITLFHKCDSLSRMALSSPCQTAAFELRCLSRLLFKAETSFTNKRSLVSHWYHT